jgi:hypothetical protein
LKQHANRISALEDSVVPLPGRFAPDGYEQMHGQLTILGMSSRLTTFGSTFQSDVQQDIQGVLFSGAKCSLLACRVSSSSSAKGLDGSRVSSQEFAPEFILQGQAFLSSTEESVLEISFTTRDALKIFDNGAFGSIEPGPEALDKLIKPNPWTLEKPSIGLGPWVSYFAGMVEILSIGTELGQIVVQHSPTPEKTKHGVDVLDNEVRVRIQFDSAVTVDDAFHRALRISNFLALVTGRFQELCNLQCESTGLDGADHELSLYVCGNPQARTPSKARKSRSSLLIDGGLNPADFAGVLAGWIKLDAKRKLSRQRLLTGFTAGIYDIDRLIAAANIFDLLPRELTGSRIPLSEATKTAVSQSIKLFKALEPSDVTENVLRILRQIDSKTLKQKIRSRIEVIRPHLGENCAELANVTDRAVDCRNYFVHGPRDAADRRGAEEFWPFLTSTLEFVFATADLVDAGWNFIGWDAGRGHSHPFSRYLSNFDHDYHALEKGFA